MVIAGPEAEGNWNKLVALYFPSALLVVAGENSSLELLEGRIGLDTNQIFVCEDGACWLPEENVESFIGMLNLLSKHKHS